jgi:diguanylate cyclase (GGDEF)-like protein
MASRILIVDDEDVVRSVIRQVLVDDGHDIVDMPNGEAALEAFRREPFSVVLTDIYMPGMNGIELLEEIRLLDPDCLVVVMTSNASLETATAALRAGAYDYITKPFEDIDLISAVVRRALDRIALIEDNRSLLERLKTNAEELEKLNARLRDQANRDGLTGLYNHRYFRERLEKEINSNPGGPLSLVFMDIDHFKRYNDNHGHLAGDTLLKTLADVLRQHTDKHGQAARYGGEEFVVLLPECDKDAAEALGETLRTAIEKYPFFGREEQPQGRVTLSLGVASFPEDGQNGTTVIDHADQALYEAKRQGRNQLCCFGSSCAPVGAPE